MQKKFHIVSISILCLIGCYIIVRGTVVFSGDYRYDLGYQLRYMAENTLQEAIVGTHIPSFTYAMEGQKQNEDSFPGWLMEKALGAIPIFTFAKEYQTYETDIESDIYEQIILSEAMDENSRNADEVMNQAQEEEDAQLSALMENENAAESHIKGNPELYDLNKLSDYQYLVSNYYVVDKTTATSENQLNVKALLSKNMELSTKNDKPQILIYHTHSQEGFADSTPGDVSTTVVGVGEQLTKLLKGYGYNVIHHTGQYDLKDRNYAYSNAGPAIEKILKENPSIEVIIDLHRDGVAEGTRLVSQYNGKTMAQFMFFNGLSYTNSTGAIAYLENPYIADNLSFAFQLQLKCNEFYPGVARKIYLKGYRYNMHYRPKSLLLEVGAQTNTVEEAMNTMAPVASVLDKVLSGK